jgi:hypothetical protein
MSRSVRYLIATLLLACGIARAQQSNADAGASAPEPLAPTPSLPPSLQPTPQPSEQSSNQPAPAPADALVPPPDGAPTPGPESIAPAPSKSSKGSKSADENKGQPKTPSDELVSKSEVQAIAVQPPPNDSPFFIERQEARDAAAKAGREGYGMYVPKPPKPPAQQQIKKFFQGFFGKKKSGAAHGSAPMTLTIDPSDFSLSQTSELDVSLRISNAKKHEIEFLFPDNQRLEILTKDSSGAIVSRWSEDRAFDPQEGFTEINPAESVIYAEHISTAKMKAGETYTIEASLANQEGYTTSVTVTPKP